MLWVNTILSGPNGSMDYGKEKKEELNIMWGQDANTLYGDTWKDLEKNTWLQILILLVSWWETYNIDDAIK